MNQPARDLPFSRKPQLLRRVVSAAPRRDTPQSVTTLTTPSIFG